MTIRQKFNEFVEYRRTVRALNALDKRQLADIGIRRDEIPALARRSF